MKRHLPGSLLLCLLAVTPIQAMNDTSCTNPGDWKALVSEREADAQRQRALDKEAAQKAAMALVHQMVETHDPQAKERLLDELKVRVAVDDTFQSALLAKKIGEAGAAGKQVFAMMSEVQEDIGALTAPGAREGTLRSLARRLPWFGSGVSRRINRGESTEEALDRIARRVQEQRVETRQTKQELRRTVREWERLVGTFETKAEQLEAIRQVLEERLVDLPRGSEDRDALQDVIDILADRELICRTNVANLLKALDSSVHVVTLLNQGERLLDTVANTQLVQLKIDMTTINALGSADKVQGTVAAITELASQTRLALAQNIARVTDLNIEAMNNAMKDPNADEVKRLLDGARSRQIEHEAQRNEQRAKKIAELKADAATMHRQLEADRKANDRLEASLSASPHELPGSPTASDQGGATP